MLRILACLLAGLLALLPAAAQTGSRGSSAVISADGGAEMQKSAVISASRSVPGEITLRSGHRSTIEPLRSAALGQEHAVRSTTVRHQAGALAAAVLHALASQNTVNLHPEMDEVLRPPKRGSGEPSIFDDAKKLYDAATTYQSDRAVVTVDPLGLSCRVRINLGRLLSGSESAR